jgi:hypothetical protein
VVVWSAAVVVADAVVAGVVLATAGAGLVGLRGPRTTPLALACAGLFAAGWLALRRR